MSDGEGHSDNLELGGSSNLVHNKEPGKIRGGGKRMEEKEKKPKRHYKKRTPKPAPAAIPQQTEGEKKEEQQEEEHQKLIETESPREIMNPLRNKQEPQPNHLSLRQNSSTLQEDQAKFCNSTPISSSPLTGSSPLESPSLPVQPATTMTSTLGMKKVE